LSNGLKKSIAYIAIILALAAGSFVLFEVMTLREVVKNPENFASGTNLEPARRDRDEGDFSRFSSFSSPDVGAEGPMTPAELAWLLREGIILDVIGNFVTGGESLDSYNARVRAYNERSRSIAYRDSDMKAAVDRVAGIKSAIVRDAIEEALKLSMPEKIAGDTASSAIWTAQSLLRVMGLLPDLPNGRESDGTSYAVKTYEIMIGVQPDGRINDVLTARLIDSCVRRLTPSGVGFSTGE
jgi:hypothetical protein